MIIASFVILAQGFKKAVLMLPAPRGIYKPDFSTCSKEERGLYERLVPGYLSLMKSRFDLSIFDGTWTEKDGRMFMQTESVGYRPVEVKSGQTTFKTFKEGFVFKKATDGSLILTAEGSSIFKSTLTFRRIPAMKVYDAVKLAWLSDRDGNEDEKWLSQAAIVQLGDAKNEIAETLLDIVRSEEAFAVRTAAARTLAGVTSVEIIKSVGYHLVLQEATEDREKSRFCSALGQILVSSKNPEAIPYAMRAYELRIISGYLASRIVAHCGTVKNVPLILKIAKASPESLLGGILSSLRELSPTDALNLAKEYVNAKDEKLVTEVNRMLAELDTDEQIKIRAVKRLIEIFELSNPLAQSEIVESLGKSHTEVAHQALLGYAKRDFEEFLNRAVRKALEEYKKL